MTGDADPDAAPSSAQGSVKQYVVAAILILLIAAYASAAFLTRSTWADPPPQVRASVTFSAQASDGSPPSPEAMAQAEDALAKRVTALGMADVERNVDGDKLTVTATGNDDGALREIGDIGRIFMRPVIHVMPAETAAPTAGAPPSPPPKGPNTDLAQRIADEKELRQSGDRQIQVLALQFQATRCAEHDVLTGNDDPNLPLVTCSKDDTRVYLLDKSILSGDQISNASAQVDDRSGTDTVEMTFDEAGARTLATFTEANVGTQLAYAVDTQVVSAPEIAEAIPDGRVVITGPTSAGQARALAATLSGGTLPIELSFESSKTEQVAVESGWTPLRVGMLVGGVLVALVVIGGATYLILS